MGVLDQHIERIKKLYYEKGYSMNDVAKHYRVSLDMVVHIMRKYDLKRRSHHEANHQWFSKKIPSYRIRSLQKKYNELKSAGAMLYWAEGYNSPKGKGVDFANSNPQMIKLFLKFLRTTYELDEKRFRIYLYCYADQDVKGIISFWAETTDIPTSQFLKPYIRQDFRIDGRKMLHGLIHIRYHDKKLLIEIKNLIKYYESKYCVGTQVVNEGAL
ncbi:MAG TPA: hypothetical protein VI981_01905 [Candidatus Paceibacterota bacterium]